MFATLTKYQLPVCGTASIDARVSLEGPINVKDDETKVGDGVDSAANAEFLIIVEPLDVHGSIADWFYAAVEVGRLTLGHCDVLQKKS